MGETQITVPAYLVALGEVLVDFTPAGTSEAGQALFERNPGGAPANVAVQAVRLGLDAQFVGRVGADAHGRFLRRTLKEEGVGCAYLVEDPDAFTTLAFVEVEPVSGERTFSFARKPGADTRLAPCDVPEALVRGARLVHVGSLSLTDEPARSATLLAVHEAKDAGVLVSYDPNYRAPLWPDEDTARTHMAQLLDEADLVKVSLEEAALLFGTDDAERAADAILARGVRLVAVTLGAQGALLATRPARTRMPSAPCTPCDTTGAGDAFWGAALAWLALERNVRTRQDLDALDTNDLQELGRYACAAAACCVEGRGAIPSLPDDAAIRARMNRQA